jgi:heme-degrading monooxygenase HmoA
MFATIRMFEGVGPREEVLPLVREHVFLTITGAPGFRGYYAFLDEAETRRGVSVSLFDTREHAIEANAWVVSVMRERRIAPNPPRAMAGHVVIVAAAEG